MRSINDLLRCLSLLAAIVVLSLTGCGDSDKAPANEALPKAFVSDVSPQLYAQEVAVTSLVVVHLSRAVTAAEVEQFSFGLYLGEDTVSIRMTLLPDGQTLVLDPAHDLQPAAVYELHGRSRLREASERSGEMSALTSFTTSASSEGGPEFLFDPTDSTRLTPYPTDLFTVPDSSSATGLRVRIPHDLVISIMRPEDLESQDGFSPYPRLILPLSSAPDLETLPQDVEDTTSPLSPLFLVDLEDPGFRRVPVFIELDPYGPLQRPPTFCLKVIPLTPLDLSRHYALVATRRLISPTGAPAEPSPCFRRIIQGETSSELEKASRLIRPLVDTLSSPDRDLPLDPEDLALVLPFTTRSLANLAGELVQIRDYFSEHCPQSPPRVKVSSVTIPGFTPEKGQGHVALYVKGTVESPDFRNRQGVFDQGLVWNHPEDAPLVPLDFILSIPKGAATTPSPVVIFLHGINDVKEVLYTITDDLASYNLAVIAIDVVEHGSRATTDLTPWIPFLRIDALHCGRDNMRQTQVDLLNLSWAIRTALAEPDLFYWEEGGGFLQLDPERIFYIAESLGSILAPGYLALDDAVSGAVLFVGAGNLTEIVTRFEFIQPGETLFNLIAFGLGFIRDYSIAELLYGTLGLGQEILDKADPLTYAPFVIKEDLTGSHTPKDVLFIQVIKDQTLANVTNEHLSRALGLDLVAPAKHEIPGIRVVAPPLRGNGPRGCTTGLIQFDEITVDGEKVKAEHNNILKGHEPVQATCVFLRTLADTGRATVEDTRFPYSSPTLSGSTYRNGLPD